MVGAIVVLYTLWALAGWVFNYTATAYGKRIKALENQNAARADEITLLNNRIAALTNALQPKQDLTPAPTKPKIVARPHRVNWRNFRSAAESASEPELEDA
jgi:hypothetical protein